MQIQLCLLLTNQVQTYDYDYLFARSAANQPNLKTPDYTYLPLGSAVVYRLCTSLLISCGPQQVLKSWIADRVDLGSRIACVVHITYVGYTIPWHSKIPDHEVWSLNYVST
jgi:hypothetical protein